ncbi:putative small lipoprotein YifL [Sagittula marina]|uniref:Putative small lipoprotein YifL n=1 Tax=Sagittula marina TaxID=943940 RepID=A0A7W6DID2_9RHOB|nr:argininosuccinate lyase [Sagittula marina]MBB3983811.1 putative small lipoprotein YifL [Sagittula marina]
MIRTGLFLMTLALLAGCGADGDPQPPVADSRPEPGLAVRGTVSVGITG